MFRCLVRESDVGQVAMIQLNTVLVPTDFSDFSRPAIDYGCALASEFGSELHLLNVVQDPMVYSPEPTLLKIETIEEYVSELKAVATMALAHLPGDGWNFGEPIVRQIRHGSPFVEILRYVKEADIDLIVIGTHGRTGLKHVFLGSVAERVVRKASCSVLTVRADGHQFVMP